MGAAKGTSMAPAQQELVERLRHRLADQPELREVSMFGGRAFMVRDKMVACAWKNGELLVRVSADRHDDLVGLAGASTAVMGVDRSMGPGRIEVDAEAISDEGGLAYWLGVALEHNRMTAGGRTGDGRTKRAEPRSRSGGAGPPAQTAPTPKSRPSA